MAEKESYIEWVLELLEAVGGVTERAMFGGYGIFADGDMFALVSKEPGLYFKVDDSNREHYESAGSSQYRPMPYFSVPAEILEDQQAFLEWARESIAIAHATSKKKGAR